MSTALKLEKKKLKVQKHIVANYKEQNQVEMAQAMKVTLKTIVASRIALGGIVGTDSNHIVSIDSAKADAIIKGREEKIAKLKAKVSKKLSSLDKAVKEVKTNKYSNADGTYKQQAREMMIEACKVQGVTPTLPFSTCELEKQFLAKKGKGFEFIGCEKELDTFGDMVNTIREDKVLKKAITPFYGLIGDLLKNATESQFANLILDYCGVLDTFKDEIKDVIDRDLMSVGGAMCVTLSKMGISNKDGIIGKIMSQFPTGMFGDEIGDTELATKLFFTSILKDGYSIEEFFSYQDDVKDENGQPVLKKNGAVKKKMPMMLIIVRRNK
jgi:hypothetical protein